MSEKVNKRVEARLVAIRHWAKEWGLTELQAADKFKHQDKKWQKKQVNQFLRQLRG